MQWIYRLQQRLSITRHEALAVLTLAALFLLGLAVRYLQGRPEPLPPGTYAEADRLFAEGTASLDSTARAAPLAPATRAGAGSPAAVAAPGAPSTAASTPLALPAGRLDLNAATAAELERLPRVGPKMAERILDYRRQHGPFKRVRDLLHVRGIGEKTLALLEPHVFVE